MKTDKFNNTTDTLNDNVSNSMKWMQDSAALFLETQNKQLKFATDMYSHAINTSFENFSKGNFNNVFGSTEKLGEMIQKNIESISRLSEENMKTIMEVSKQANSTLFSKEAMEQIVESYSKNAEAITAFNQNAFEALNKQTELSKQYIKPLAENLKNEFEKNTQLFNTTMKQMMGSFSNMGNPSFDTNNNVFGQLTNQMQSMFQNSLQSWTGLMNKYQNFNDDDKSENGFATSKKAEQKETQTSKSKLHSSHV